MGFLDFLFDKEAAEERRIKKLKKKLTNMYVQDAERQYAVEELREIGTPEAIQALLARFEETSHNHTTDPDEKQFVYTVLVDLGRRGEVDVVQIITDYLKEADENINWPLKVLTDLVSYDEMVDVLAELLSALDIGYRRNPEKKQELMLRAAEFEDPRLAEEVIRFLEDDNETIRFLAVDAAMAQNEDDIVEEAMRERLRTEESLRTVQKITDIFVDNPAWTIPEDDQEEVEQNLPDGFGVHKKGHIYRKRK